MRVSFPTDNVASPTLPNVLSKDTTPTLSLIMPLIFLSLSSAQSILLPSLVINQAGTRTIPLSMFFFFGQYTKQWDLALAGLVLTIIPVLIFYFFAQKHIIKSVTVGSIK